MPRPSHISLDGRCEIERIAKERANLPSDAELASKHGVSPRRIQQIMKTVRDGINSALCRENTEKHGVIT